MKISTIKQRKITKMMQHIKNITLEKYSVHPCKTCSSGISILQSPCSQWLLINFLLILLMCAPILVAYPLDGYEKTQIRRLDAARRVQEGTMTGNKLSKGALLPSAKVDIRLRDRTELDLPAPDESFTQEIVKLLGENADRYSLAVLDISDPENPRYAEHRATELYNPGSVGKLMVAMGLFQLLADLYPEDIEARWHVLRDTRVMADEFIITDHHPVRIWDPQMEIFEHRKLEIGDEGNLFDFLDWMVSASANAAASIVIKESMLLKQYGKTYPVPVQESQDYFIKTPKGKLHQTLTEVLMNPVSKNGLNINQLRQGSFFTSTGNRYVPGAKSYASARELLRFLLRMEQGRIVDPFSSREIKRLMYSTERRIRYASSPALYNAAVYFKSGSLYECEPEPDFVCKKYHGNVKNLMNSVAIVEAPAGEANLYYLVALMSNVLRKNSAVDHQTLATEIHKVIEAHHKKE